MKMALINIRLLKNKDRLLIITFYNLIVIKTFYMKMELVNKLIWRSFKPTDV